jgi:hypothetical protein
VVATWPIAPGEMAAGLAIDVEHHRLFIGCHNKVLVMMDSTNGKVLATIPVGKGVDATWYDPGTRLISGRPLLPNSWPNFIRFRWARKRCGGG